MKLNNSVSTTLFAAVIVLGLLLFSSCFDITTPETGNSGIVMAKGSTDLMTALENLDNPLGIMPETLAVPEDQGGIIKKETDGYHEFFAFDTKKCIIVLSADPIYFMVLDTPEFYRHLLSEYEQIASGTTPSNKKLNTVENYVEIGDYEIGLFFTPKEMKYYQGRFQDSISTSYVDPYRLYNAAQKVWFYTPVFKEETIYTDLLAKWLNNHSSVIQYTRQEDFPSGFDNQHITYYTKDDIYCNFSFIMGEDLFLTDELLGTEDINFENQIELTRDFSVFVSVPLGNSQNLAEAYLADDASGRHGICVVIRGNQGYFKDYLEKENIVFNPVEELPLSLTTVDTYSGQSLTLDWGDEKGEMNLWIKKEGEEYKALPDAIVSGTSHTLSSLERGSFYTFKLTEKDRDTNVLAELESYFTDLVITEICYWGSSYPGTVNGSETEQRGSNSDDWIEIKNISSASIDMSDLILYWYNSNKKRDVWFSIYESGNYEPLDISLAPGQRIVISNDRNDEFFFSRYSPAPLIRKRGSKSSVTLGEQYSLELVRNSKTLLAVLIDGEYGDKAPFKTMVLDASGEWQTSTIDSNTNPGPAEALGNNTEAMLHNFCTPGYAAEGEM